MAFEFVEEYYDPLTFTECMVESYGEGIRISTDLGDEGNGVNLSKEEAVKLAIKIYSFCYQEDWSYLE